MSSLYETRILEVLSFFHQKDHELTSRFFSDYSLAPYERRVIELLRNSKDKRARKLAKKRVSSSYPPPFASML